MTKLKNTKLENPLVTVAVFAFNQEQYIAEAINSVLGQSYSPLEIIISDDCSRDTTWDVIQNTVRGYGGPHKIYLNRNATNLGIGSHVSFVSKMAQGELIVGAAGDDISFPERTEKLVKEYVKSGQKYVYLYSDFEVLSEDGHLNFSLGDLDPQRLTIEYMAKRNSGSAGCSSAWTKNIFSLFGDIPHEVMHEDMVLPFRAALAGRVIYINEPLIQYRRHSNNVWQSKADIKNVEQQVNNTLRHLEGYLSLVKCRIDDLNEYVATRPTAYFDKNKIMNYLHRTQQEVMTERRIFSSRSALSAMAIIFGSLSKGVRPKKVAGFYMKYFMPNMYLWIQRRRWLNKHGDGHGNRS